MGSRLYMYRAYSCKDVSHSSVFIWRRPPVLPVKFLRKTQILFPKKPRKTQITKTNIIYIYIYIYIHTYITYIIYIYYRVGVTQWRRPGAEFGGTKTNFADLNDIFPGKIPFSGQKFLTTFF